MPQSDFVISIGGEAGEGVQSTGDLVVQIAARAGFTVLTNRVPPAEIKGGLYEYQIRLSNGPLYSQGDELDIATRSPFLFPKPATLQFAFHLRQQVRNRQFLKVLRIEPLQFRAVENRVCAANAL